MDIEKRTILLLEKIVNSPKVYDRITGRASFRPHLNADEVMKLYLELCIAASSQPKQEEPSP